MTSVPFADPGLLDGFYGGFGGGHGHDEYGLSISQLTAPSTSPVVLDGGGSGTADPLLADAAASTETEAPKRKGDHHRDDKAAMALKSHSEAERRRRERINAHLATLRTMVPCSDKVSASDLSPFHSCSLTCTRRPDQSVEVPGAGAVATVVAPACPSAVRCRDAAWRCRLLCVLWWGTGQSPSRRKARWLASGPRPRANGTPD